VLGHVIDNKLVIVREGGRGHPDLGGEHAGVPVGNDFRRVGLGPEVAPQNREVGACGC
jgi:hypothetical protein